MAAGIKIYGDLKFIGYEQDRRSGKNGQYLRYLDGVAAWADVHETAANNLVTVPSTESVLIDEDGNVITFGLDETYHGIETKPPFEQDSGGRAVFLGTQSEYDARVWRTGDMFIPTTNFIATTGITSGTTAQLDITFTNPYPVPADFLKFRFLSNAIADSEAAGGDNLHLMSRTPDAGITNYNISSLQISINSANASTETTLVRSDSTTLELRIGTDITDSFNAATSAADVLNAMSTESASGTRFGSGVISRNFVALSSDNVLVLRYIPFPGAITPNGGSPADQTITFSAQGEIPGGETETFRFIKDTIYIRSLANNGWIEYRVAERSFTEN